MGSYNVSCGVSRLSIGPGTPMVLIPLISAGKWAERCDVGANVVSNEGPKAVNVPFTLPIFGLYNDYGGLENIQEDCNTKAIEKYFGCKIQKFADEVCCLSDDGKIGNGKIPKKPLGMFVHRDVYDWLANNPQSEFKNKTESAWDTTYVSDYLLNLCGFVEGKKDEKRERYNRPFTHIDIDGLVVWSDETWVEVEINGEKINWGIYNPEDLVEFLNKHSLYVLPILYTFKDRLYYDVEYDKELEKLKKTKLGKEAMFKEFKSLGKTDAEAKRFTSIFDNLTDCCLMFRFGSRYADKDTFYEIYSGLLDDKSLKDMVVKFRTFEHGLWTVNAPYMPSWNGYQCGCHYANYNLSKVVKGILEKKFRENRIDEIKSWWWGVKYNIKELFKKWKKRILKKKKK